MMIAFISNVKSVFEKVIPLKKHLVSPGPRISDKNMRLYYTFKDSLTKIPTLKQI